MSSPQPSQATAQRPHTGRGVPADRPDGVYEPPELVQPTGTGLEVTAVGEDGRRRTFGMKTFPLPGWHQPLAEAFARCTGASGTLRTPESAAGVFWSCRRFLVALDAMADSPATPAELTVDHLERYWRRGIRSMNEVMPLSEAPKAYERMLSGQARFRVVLDPHA